ncbi:MAG TPA: homoserine kinase [Actinocrinis sp.]|uniref:homoserine kinase n=1 Tax=Actinocrinis sp. TaxID=1920516 RepID=UPI002DDD1916|nr:homoserine kinase [Actinocrinis sp.]HEV3169338.1 homoserine kinase [Actinocrinis sp.]
MSGDTGVRFLTGPVTVRPPATSANLGPGFDSFGLALELRDEVTVQVTEAPGLSIEVYGEGAHDVPRDESHLLVRALRAGFDALGGQPPGLRVVCRNNIPHGRGLGSSSAAICAGLVAARDSVEGGESVLDTAALLDLATRLEGHPDNVAPALCGGLTIAWMEEPDPAPDAAGPERMEQGAAKEERPDVLRLMTDRAVSAVVFIPPTPLATAVARGLLPDRVPHRDAAFNAGRAGLLAAALTTPDLTHHHRAVLLRAATRDRLHQDYRAPAMPESAALIQRLRADGYAATVSGAGPTVLALTVGPGRPEQAAGYAPEGWRAAILPIAATGVATGP